MNLTEHYNKLYNQSIEKIREGNVLTDKLIDDENDKRRGLTVLIRPSEDIKKRIQHFQGEMSNIDNQQYYQPISDMHITVLSIISCYDGFDLSQVNIPNYVHLIKESIRNTPKISLQFKGISTSREAVMVQGFPLNDNLEYLRNRLRSNFKATSLQQSIDARYTISTAHITTARFREQIQHPEKYAELLENYRNVDFGHFKPEAVELVYNDWYQKAHIVETLFKAHL